MNMIDSTRQAEPSPEELQALLAAIVSSSDDAIISKDLNGVVLSWNAAAERMFGYRADEIVGRPITVLFPPDRMGEEPRILEQLRRGERVDHFETVRVRKDGTAIDVSVTISPVKDASGRVVGVSKVARDITELKRIVREREELLARERDARQDAERASRIKDDFLATLSHELRTPLNAILGWAHLLRNPGLPADEVELGMETIERNARAQAQLIDDLLDMSRIISGKLRLNVQPVDLQAVVSSAVESVRPAADAKGIRLNKILDPKAGPVAGDPNRLQQVLWNLLTNAVKFTPQDGRIQVFLQRVEGQAEVTVSDSGAGIPAEFLPNVFARFAQADSSTTRRHGGLGLGLAIVRHLVELHGGTVRAASAGEGRGATFVVTLPISVPRDDRSNRPAVRMGAEGGGVAAVDLSGVKVLVVDDDLDARQMVQRVLAKFRAAVVTAESAAEALATLRRERPDVLLSDIGMPLEDGYELLAKVRRLAPADGGDTPAVALTAFARPEDRRRALMAGFQMHLAKPVEPMELLAVVSDLSRSNR